MSEQTRVIRHFGVHCFEQATIKILAIVPDVRSRLWYESKFMQSSGSLYPYGMNQVYYGRDIGAKHDIVSIVNVLNSCPTNRGKRGKKKNLGCRMNRRTLDFDFIKRNREFDDVDIVIKESDIWA